MSRVIKFRDDCFGQRFFNLKELRLLKQLLEQSHNGIALLPEDGKKFDNRIISIFQATAPLRVVGFLELLCQIAYTRKHLLLTTPFSIPPDDVDTERINRVLVYINRHLGEKMTLAQISRVAGLTSVVFSRVFSRIVRKTFSQYVLELRIGKACRLLTETTRCIIEIAYESGFQNLSNFNRLFRKYRHMTPREFRNLSRSTIAEKNKRIVA
jgi:AraC-like DNA-binding protein